MADNPAEISTPTGQKIKKTKGKLESGPIRQRHLNKGAFLVEFATPPAPLDMLGGRLIPAELLPASKFSGKTLRQTADQYRTMERKGFRVTKDIGCLIPDEQYGVAKKGSTVKGHQRTFAFFAHWVPGSGDTIRNEFGWPTNLQISHLCHRRSCCRVDHLVAEEQWRNLKRNYCGLNGNCDCGNPIQCLRRYQMQDQADFPALCETQAEVEEVLQGAPAFVIHGSNRFESRDQKAKQRNANRLKRKRKQELHQHATQRKQARLAPEAEEAATSSDDDFEEEA